jgi:hypothetical protein
MKGPYRQRLGEINSVVDDEVALAAAFAGHALPRDSVILVWTRDNISRHSDHAAINVLESSGEANQRIMQRNSPLHVQVVADALEQLVRICGDDKHEIAGVMPDFFVGNTIESDALAVHGALWNVDHETYLFRAGDGFAVLAVVLPTLAL